MIIGKGQVFNLWDTNGRRADVLNALHIYLEILKENKEAFPEDEWNSYPTSLAQYRFYEQAIFKSPEVFRKHPIRDAFVEWLQGKESRFLRKDTKWFSDIKREPLGDKTIADILDEGIEKRARHHTNNLVKWGFANDGREISQAGYSFLSGKTTRDEIESLLPIDDTNLILLRQAVKLRIYADKPNENGRYSYYSPFYMAVYLLLFHDKKISNSEFRTIIQQTTPFYQSKYTLSQIISGEALDKELSSTSIPKELGTNEILGNSVFIQYFKNAKSGKTIDLYYEFYKLLCRLVSKDETVVNELALFVKENKSKLEQAFGEESELKLKDKESIKDVLAANENNILLTASDILDLNKKLYLVFLRSKTLDQAREYSDTTVRMLNATGIFEFSKARPDIHFRSIIETIFGDDIESLILGESSEEERTSFENRFCQSVSLKEILSISTSTIQGKLKKLCETQGVAVEELPDLFKKQKNKELKRHIETKYTKEKIEELLALFSDRTNDQEIKKQVNPAATVPTIYEFIIAIAWYYISGDFDLYESMNLSLNGDYEPELHAGGGEGDIVINEETRTTMLEVTLMNKQAQKRGEWEPVLRHAVNLTVDKAPTPVTTLFIADELDYNTINIWRAVTTVPLESTATGERTSKVVIMPFTNKDILGFLRKNVQANTIISAVRSSYEALNVDFDEEWREKILCQITGAQ